MNKIVSNILCLAVATHCWAEDNASSKVGFFTHENPQIQIAVTSEDIEVQRFVNLGLKECLYSHNTGAASYFDEALALDEHCVLAHIGMLMITPLRSDLYREHLKKLNECLDAAPLTPVEEWYVATFIQYLNGDLTGAAKAFQDRAAMYRRDAMAACWDIILNLYAGEAYETLQPRADKLVASCPDAPLAHFCRAIIDQYAEKPSAAALESARKAVSLTEKSIHPVINQLAGHLLYRAGEYSAAKSCFDNTLKAADASSEAHVAAQLYQHALSIASGDKNSWVSALKTARTLSEKAPATPPADDGGLLHYWEGKTLLLRMLVLQKTPPGGAAINMAAKSCNAPEGHPLRIVQDCLVESIRARSLAETGRITTATATFTKAEQHLLRLQKEGESYVQTGGITHTCYQRALRACSGALYRAKLALYKDSADIWKPYLDDILNRPEPRMLPPILPHSADKP